VFFGISCYLAASAFAVNYAERITTGTTMEVCRYACAPPAFDKRPSRIGNWLLNAYHYFARPSAKGITEWP
jgi:hypothetical protein